MLLRVVLTAIYLNSSDLGRCGKFFKSLKSEFGDIIFRITLNASPVQQLDPEYLSPGGVSVNIFYAVSIFPLDASTQTFSRVHHNQRPIGLPAVVTEKIADSLDHLVLLSNTPL